MLPSFLAKDRECSPVCRLSELSSRPGDRECSERNGRGAPSAACHSPAGAPYEPIPPPSYCRLPPPVLPAPPSFSPSPHLPPHPSSAQCPPLHLAVFPPFLNPSPWHWLGPAQAATTSAAAAHLSARPLRPAAVATTGGSAAPRCAWSPSVSSPGQRIGVSPPLLPSCSRFPLPALGLCPLGGRPLIGGHSAGGGVLLPRL